MNDFTRRPPEIMFNDIPKSVIFDLYPQYKMALNVHYLDKEAGIYIKVIPELLLRLSPDMLPLYCFRTKSEFLQGPIEQDALPMRLNSLIKFSILDFNKFFFKLDISTRLKFDAFYGYPSEAEMAKTIRQALTNASV